jgi:peptidoglycan/LPS O-acetylase OafA/YrhL
MVKDGERNISIDVLRAVAILVVIALHTVNTQLAAPTPTSFVPIADAFVQIAGHGPYGVTLFFVLSGFLITRMTMMREPELFSLSVRDFYALRLARIQPLLLAVIVFGLALIWGADAESDRVFQYIFRDPQGISGAELAGLLVKLFNSFSCFDTLALGMLCALLGDRLPHGRALCIAAMAGGAAAIGIAFYRGGVVPLILGALLFIHGARYVDIFAGWGRPLARIGQLSYGLYLLHATAVYIASPLLPRVDILVGFIAMLGLAYVMAEISYRFYEAPTNRWLRARLLDRRHRLGVTSPLTEPAPCRST